MSVSLLKHKELPACYGTVNDKTVRCAKVSGRGKVYIPFENTQKTGTFKHKYSLSQTVCEFYYCTVEINGQVYENVCCNSNDFPKIHIGDRVLISNDIGYNLPVVYALSNKT